MGREPGAGKVLKHLRRRLARLLVPGQPGGAATPVDLMTDEEFVDHLYRNFLGRDPDLQGKATQVGFLRSGNSRVTLVLNIVSSPEFVFKTVRDNIKDYVKLLPIIDERPGNYVIEKNRSGDEKSRFFIAESPADFDWLESKITGNGYYERPGVWSFNIDEDKLMMAEIAASFRPAAVLDIGCSNGAVLKCLADRGIRGEGVDVSRLALDKAPDDIRDSIHLGDLLDVSLPRRFDLILGLDIFEHLNPNKLDAYLARAFSLLEAGGHLFTNIPAFGSDTVFGEVFPIDYPIWDADVSAGRIFRAVPVDDYGYPKNGHIVNAGTTWWVEAFERHGFLREPEIEREIHRRHDAAIDRISPARRSFYVFSKRGSSAAA